MYIHSVENIKITVVIVRKFEINLQELINFLENLIFRKRENCAFYFYILYML